MWESLEWEFCSVKTLIKDGGIYVVASQALRCFWWWEPAVALLTRRLYCFIGPEVSVAARCLAPDLMDGVPLDHC